MKLKKNDEVKIVSGKDKGKGGKIEKVLSKEDKVVVTGINQYKRHVKKRAGKAGEIVTITKPLPVSAVMFLCPKCNKPARLGFGLKNGKKIRTCKKCRQAV